MKTEPLRVSYLRGLYDGLQPPNVSWASAYSVLDELTGMDLLQLKEEINRVCRENAEPRSNPRRNDIGNHS
jgi:hypothetical protein